MIDKILKSFASNKAPINKILPLPDSYPYPIDMPKNEHESDVKISFPLADSQFSPPLFWPTEKWKGGSRSGYRYIKNAYQVMYATMEDMGYFVNRCPPSDASLVFDWSEKNDSSDMNINRIIIEHGWLPRSSYQLSPLGTNARGHFSKQFKLHSVDTKQKEYVLKQVSIMKMIFDSKISNVNVDKIEKMINSPFVLFPFQLATDFNLKFSNSNFSNYYCDNPQGNVDFAQACIDFIEDSRLSIPVVYKQHPQDNSNLGDQLKIRNKDSVLIQNSEKISSFDLLSSDKCKLVVSVNSNTLHEALVCNVPIISLGTLLWNENSLSWPFASDLSQADILIGENPLNDDNTICYLFNLFSNQWFLSDFQNPLMVQRLIQTKGDCVPLELRHEFGLGTLSAF